MPHSKRTTSGVLGGLMGLVGLSAVAGILVTATVTPALALSGAAATGAISMFDNMPSVLVIDDLMEPSTIYYKNKEGKDVELAKFADQNRTPVTFDQVAPVMYDAILSSEDKNFYQHGGIDLLGTAKAAFDYVRGTSTRGASSISQQYVKNVLVQKCEWDAETDTDRQKCYDEAVESKGSDGLQRKLQEVRYAIQLEKEYSKNEILLGYLNIANFGGTTYGIESAAKYYFNVPAKNLSLAQAATIAGMVQNPNTYRIDMRGGSTTNAQGEAINSEEDGYALTKDRRHYVLGRMLADGKITREQYDEADAAPVEPQITPLTTGCAAAKDKAYFCQYVLSIIKNDPAFGEEEERLANLKRGGLQIYTSLDIDLQTAAEKAMKKYAPGTIDGMEFGSTAVNLEASTGRILSIAQNTKFAEDPDFLKKNPEYEPIVFAGDLQNGGSIGFSAGSTFKLFTLVDWLEQGHSVNEVLNGRNRVFKRMTNSCEGDWVNFKGSKIGNFADAPGFVGTVMRFTAQSLNSGYLAMASELDLCDIAKVATKMGIETGDGRAIDMGVANNVIGDDNISPIAMAGAYATIANKGVYCQPRAIDKITDRDGNEQPLPERTCKQVVDPKVAATAAYALKGVMNGGTGNRANPYDGTQVIGKTGTHEKFQTWMVESSTKVTTAVWVGQSNGNKVNLYNKYAKGYNVPDLRYPIARAIQSAANDKYEAGDFPAPDRTLTRQVLKDLPNVTGMTVEQATKKLEDAGFDVKVGGPVDSTEAEGIVAEQSPGAGKVAGGTTVTISPSNGQGVTVPPVAGMRLEDAINTLRSQGFGNVQPGSCTETGEGDDEGGGPGGGRFGNATATGTSPDAGNVVNRNSAISVNYQSERCR